MVEGYLESLQKSFQVWSKYKRNLLCLMKKLQIVSQMSFKYEPKHCGCDLNVNEL